ncbi:MAG: PilN domain-containing protein [Myxococcales bacterium]|nr:PilN domain-containing protein [Myxococcota bacterium]MDW8283849.1 PilN domain-containing protein [Myxococcales bacterium]
MIRINLFPVRQARLRERGKQHLVIGIGVLSVVVAGIVVYHGYETAQNEELQQRVHALRQAVEQLKQELGDYEQVKAQRAELQRQREAIQRLQQNRAGPVFLMRELSDILSMGKGPSFDKAEYEEALRRDPNAGFNPNWDVRRVWLTSWEEKNHEVVIKGSAKSSDDVAEFTKRLKLSPFFSDVYWQQTTPQKDEKRNVTYVNFDLRCKVSY